MCTYADTFRWESEMLDPTLAAADRWWGARRGPDFAGTEIVGPEAIADLAAVRFDRARLRLRREAGIEPIPDVLALRVLALARGRSMTSTELADACRVSRSGVRRAINFALDRNALLREQRTRYRTHDAWGPGTDRTVAVELKLQDWGAALRQSYAYSMWAHASWAILARTPPPQAVALARAEGLGLAVLAPSGGMRLLARPRSRRKVNNPLMSLLASEQVLARAQSAGCSTGDGPATPRAQLARRTSALGASLSSA